MKRPLLWAFGASILGEILAWLPVREAACAGAAFFAASACMFLAWKRKPVFGLLFLAVFFTLGFARMQTALSEVEEQKAFFSQEETRNLRLSGRVERVGETQAGYYLDMREIRWYFAQKPDVLPGDEVFISGTVQRFSQATNPGQFDQEAYYQAQGLFAQGKVENWALRARPGFSPLAALLRLKELLLAGLSRAAAWGGFEKEEGAIASLLLGERTALGEEGRRSFQVSGLSHILAVSGLHISLVGRSLYDFLKRKLHARSGAAGAVAMLATAVYGQMAGTGVSSVRAICMLGVFLYSRQKGRAYDSASAAAFAGTAILLEEPLWCFQASFQLSFCAVMAVAILWPLVSDWWTESGRLYRFPERSLLFGWCLQMATLPAVLWHYREYPVFALAVNFLALVMVPGLVLSAAAAAFLGALPLPDWISGASLLPGGLIMRGYMSGGGALAELPFAVFLTGQPQPVSLGVFLALGAAGLLFLLVSREKRRSKKQQFVETVTVQKRAKRGAILTAILLLSLLLFKRLPPKELTVTMLDVGQGQCVVLQKGDTCILIDAGSTSTNKVGTYRIVPFLKWAGVKQVDAVLVTHYDRDHMNALPEILEEVPVERILVSAAHAGNAVFSGEYPVCALHPGDGFFADWGSLICLYPAASEPLLDENEASLALALFCDEASMLFMGDLPCGKEDEVVAALSRYCPDAAAFDALQVGHHGSRHSTGEEFLSFVSPQIALISCGKNNSYGHPHPEAIARLQKSGARIYVTARTGALTLTPDGAGWTITGYRGD